MVINDELKFIPSNFGINEIFIFFIFGDFEYHDFSLCV
jgi:hypothetical protein